MVTMRAILMMSLLTSVVVPVASARSIGKIPLDTQYEIVLSGQTNDGPFKVAGS